MVIHSLSDAKEFRNCCGNITDSAELLIADVSSVDYKLAGSFKRVVRCGNDHHSAF